MADRSALVCWLLIGFYFLTTPHIYRAESKSMITRHDFPSDFIFGAGTSAYQVEGAAALDGRKPSIWDTFTHAGNMPDQSTGNVAADQYHHYKEDVALMSEMGLDAYRFSISWSRLIPGIASLQMEGESSIPRGLNTTIILSTNLSSMVLSHISHCITSICLKVWKMLMRDGSIPR